MTFHSGRKPIPLTLALVLALAMPGIIRPPICNAEGAAKKLSQQDVLNLLTGDVPSDAVAAEARKSGIAFQVTASVEQEIRGAGGSDALIEVLKELAPHPEPAASPPVLIIESTPGQCQVYVDDEPVGSTSPEGRLKLTRLAPGPHTIRISLMGYQDHEERMTLAAGESTTVAAALAKIAAAQAVPPQSPPATSTAPPSRPNPVRPPVSDANQTGNAGMGTSAAGCADVPALRSPGSSVAIRVRFVNATDSVRRVYWISFTGRQVPYATLRPRASYVQSTYAAHIWLITDAGNHCVAVFQPQRNTSVVTIDR